HHRAPLSSPTRRSSDLDPDPDPDLDPGLAAAGSAPAADLGLGPVAARFAPAAGPDPAADFASAAGPGRVALAGRAARAEFPRARSEEHTSELQSRENLV